MAPRKPSIALALIVVALASAGCTAGSETGPAVNPASAPTASTTTVTSQAPADVADQPAGLVIDVDIAGGAVTPTNAHAEATVGQPITLAVNSDAEDSIHVHSIPEHVFDVRPSPAQRFEFTVQVPGRVDVELHDLNRTIVTITVRP